LGRYMIVISSVNNNQKRKKTLSFFYKKEASRFLGVLKRSRLYFFSRILTTGKPLFYYPKV
jgi:hypothetical protein